MITTHKHTAKCTCGSSFLQVNKKMESYDPTRTIGLRKAFVADVDKRFNALIPLIKKAVINEDVFGLVTTEGKLTNNVAPESSTPGSKAFAFLTSDKKIEAFNKWLASQEKKGIIQTVTMPQIGEAVETPWTNKYIEDSYKRGIQRARNELSKTDLIVPTLENSGGLQVSFSTPFHLDRVGLIYSRTYSDLIGVSNFMDTQISRILAQGMVDGDSPQILARKLTETVGIAKNRARTIARTEVIRAHHSAMIQEYRNWGLEGVKVKAEWSTAGFGVCPICAANDGKVFTLSEIEGMIPAHPNCRCIALPTLPDEKAKEVVKEVVKPTEVKVNANTSWDYMGNNGWKTDKFFKKPQFTKSFNASLKDVNIQQVDEELTAIAEKYGIQWDYKSIEDGFRSGQLDVTFRGTWEGETVKIIRSFYQSEGKRFVEHELFSIPPGLQGKGMSKDVLSAFYKIYNKAGIENISIHANIDVGGYAWGKYGFSSNKDSALKLLNSKKNEPFYASAKNEFDEYFKNNPKATTFPMNAWAYSDYGKKMLLGSDWSGSLNLGDSVAKNIFESYLGY